MTLTWFGTNVRNQAWWEFKTTKVMEKFEEVRNYMFKSSVQETIIKVKLSISMLLIPLEKEKKKKVNKWDDRKVFKNGSDWVKKARRWSINL